MQQILFVAEWHWNTGLDRVACPKFASLEFLWLEIKQLAYIWREGSQSKDSLYSRVSPFPLPAAQTITPDTPAFYFCLICTGGNNFLFQLLLGIFTVS